MTDSDDVATLMRGRFDPTPPPQAAFALVVVEGPDANARFVIDGSEPSELFLGKSEACALRLTDAEVSRRHLALEIVGAELKIRDLRSTNGTFVNGIGVIEALLRGDEHLHVGRTTLRVDRQSSASGEQV